MLLPFRDDTKTAVQQTTAYQVDFLLIPRIDSVHLKPRWPNGGQSFLITGK